MGGFAELEHTADYALEVWGADLRDLLEAAGQGLLWLLDAPVGSPAQRWEEYEVEAEAPGPLVVRALREVLYWAERGETPVGFAVVAAGEEPARAVCRVGLTQARPQRPPRGVKAVTYHDAEVRPGPRGLEMTLTFDT